MINTQQTVEKQSGRIRTEKVEQVVRRFIEHAGNMTQSVGLGRVLGQLYAYLYFSQEPRNLGDMQEALGISKGSASTTVRQLEQWGAVQKVWVKGDRKDYYIADEWFGGMIRKAVADLVGKKIESYTALLDEAESDLNGADSSSNALSGEEFVRERVNHLRRFQQKAEQVWNSPVLRMLLK